jgi:predicted anti-sigma-YlaC factor YlaD
MTKHREIEELIQKCLDREITVDENITLQLHLSQCPDCRAFYNELESVEHSIINLTQLVPNHNFNSRVLAKIKVKSFAGWAKIAIGAGIAWLCSTLVLIFSGLGSDIFGRILTSTPSVVRFVDKVQFIVATLGRTLSPIARNQFNPVMALVMLGISIGMFFLFGKFIVKRETVCTV